MCSPLIGITTSDFRSKHELPMVGTTRQYIDSVISAGGTPLLIPSGIRQDQWAPLIGSLQGIVFSGGSDVDPQLYQESPTDLAKEIDTPRDQIEIGLVRLAVERSVPFLGICRGHQVVNVALGGSLIADIATFRPQALKHDYYPDIPRTTLAHGIRVEPGSRLREILGADTLSVNSLHHQAVNAVAPGLTPTVFSTDGIIEGLELTGHPFGITVQWHPEWLQHLPEMRSLFEAFIRSTGENR